MSAELLGKWYHEDLGGGAMHSYKFRGNLMSVQTKFQRCEIVDTQAYGQVLMLDDVLNSAQADEYIYHESLVHPAMLSHPAPRTVFIGGGGEGGTLREVLRHPGVEKCVMVDIDGELVEVFKKEPLLASYPQGAFEDPRTELIYDDAKKQLEEWEGTFDVIVLDLADPVECGPAFPLWTKEYYQTCFDKLAPDGIIVTQAGPLSANQVTEICTPVATTLGAVFPGGVATYGAHVPSFGHKWAYNLAFKTEGGAAAYAKRDPEAIDKDLAERLGEKTAALGWYDGETHRAMFSLSKPVRAALAAETRVATADNPLIFIAGEGVKELPK